MKEQLCLPQSLFFHLCPSKLAKAGWTDRCVELPERIKAEHEHVYMYVDRGRNVLEEEEEWKKVGRTWLMQSAEKRKIVPINFFVIISRHFQIMNAFNLCRLCSKRRCSLQYGTYTYLHMYYTQCTYKYVCVCDIILHLGLHN